MIWTCMCVHVPDCPVHARRNLHVHVCTLDRINDPVVSVEVYVHVWTPLMGDKDSGAS